MILTLPYHDPSGKYNQAFQRQLAALQSSFDEICISVTPPTCENNAAFVQYLEAQGCLTFHNAPGTLHAVHSREALRLGVQHAQTQQPIFFGFLDRMLFALETEWRMSFLQDIETCQNAEYLIFERSQAAWDTHPTNFREIEHMVSRIFQFLHGKFIEFLPCAFILSYPTANVILNQSTSTSFDIWGEWILLAIKNRIPITTQKVDWLAWKDPHWEHVEPDELKYQREISQEETIKRINMNAPCMLMLAEERFRHLEMPTNI